MTTRGRTRLADLPSAIIEKRQDFARDLFVVWLKTPERFEFKPGQYITIGVNGLERPYSIVSATQEPLIELMIEHIFPEHGGQLTPRLWDLKVGDTVSYRPRAKGIFTLDTNYRDHVMLATGTGIAPYVSIIRDYLARGDEGHRFFLLHGGSYQDEFVYDRELFALADRHPGSVIYVPTVSRPASDLNEGWTGCTGRVNTIIEEHLATWQRHPETTLVYACGNPGMIEDVKSRMAPAAWKVKEERFWKEDEAPLSGSANLPSTGKADSIEVQPA